MEIIKDNRCFFSEFVFHYFNNSIFDGTFPSELRNGDVILVFKKKDWNNAENYRASTTKCVNTLIIYYPNGNMCSVKALARNAAFFIRQKLGGNVWIKGV